MVKSLGNYLINNLLNEVDDDIIKLISSDNKIIKIHKCIARKSNFINLLINENYDNSVLEIKLDYKYKYIDILRDYIYDINILITINNYIELFNLSDYLSVNELSEYILNWIFKFHLICSNAISTYKLIQGSSYKESDFYEKIKSFIDKNLHEILFKTEIRILSLNEYLSLLYPELNPKLIFSSFKYWSENKNNKDLYFKKILDEKILIPGLIDIQDLFNDYFPFINELKIKIDNSEKLSIIELSNFKRNISSFCKKDYDKYIWAMNLKLGQEIDYRDNSSYKWFTGVIKYCKLIKRESVFNNTLIINIKSFNKNLEFVLPDDISLINYLYTNTIEWRKKLEINMIIKFQDINEIIPAKIIHKEGDEILIFTSKQFFFKTTIYSKDIFTSNMIYYDYFENIDFDPEKFKNIKLNTKISNIVYNYDE